MRKKLTKTGNSLALILDKPLLDRAGIDADTVLEVSTDGDVIVGDVTFTIRDNKTVVISDQDNVYSAILHRCPD